MLEEPVDARGRAATDRLHYLVSRLARALNRAMDNVALTHGLTPPEFMVFQVLGEGHAISNAQLARRTFVSSQATHEVVTELTARGLTQRDEHQTNRRIRLISLTEEGWRVLGECFAEVTAIESRILSGLDPAERTALIPSLLHSAEVIAGGYFGDDEAESAALALRMQNR
ncbi:MarR family winged helix-turn-helix transcriptional regulator [Leifsonia sp. Root112D2]|uniref:MarR family winged helix-turn-helix transcriptional regulator n=1 Tax=Leifsonia sp. Root112D2 TaxID=1736426 RepID=UPI000700E48A|nr:MarR family transcriptional regulator [Leifsonia sp. Root112D2]KQV06668.1 hypothetical protein ASC63_04470 [Leifsonia sp. Root112D2]